MSVIEANACGCPVAANDTTGLCDSCRDNEIRLLYTHCDIEDGASKVRKILTDEPLRKRLTEKRSRLGQYLQEIIEVHHA